MAKYQVKERGIIYIIPTDELFLKWKRGEAFIDEYGRLMNRKPHRVLKELKHYPVEIPAMKGSPVIDYLKESMKDRIIEVSEYVFELAVDKFFYEILPDIWHERVIPFCHTAKEVLTTKELKATTIPSQTQTSAMVNTKMKVTVKMSKEESDAEKRKVLYHWIRLLNSLTKLQNAGELDIESTLAQLTNPTMLEQVNGLLNENPNLLETDKYILLCGLLDRELYNNRQFVPIEITEIARIAASYDRAL